jgi:phage portal protein BeeE
VPPVLIADYGRATWSNGEQMAQHFLTFGILPRAKAWQGAIAKLLTAKERKELYPEFNVDELVKADIAARFEAYSKAIAARILNPNEVRAKENLPAYKGGDEFLNPNIEPTQAPAAKPKPTAGLRVVPA